MRAPGGPRGPHRGAPGRREEPRRIPILGRIAAGAPLLAEEHRDGTLPIVPEALPGRPEDFFALRVRGESMIGAHICDGDLVVVRRQDAAQPNDIVVAILGDGAEPEATVKRFMRDGDRIILKPENAAMKPIVVDPGTRGSRFSAR